MTKSITEELSRLSELHKSGTVTDEEFQNLKKKIIRGEKNQSTSIVPDKTTEEYLPVLRKLPGDSVEHKMPYTVEGNIVDLIRGVLDRENIIGLVPVNPRKLNIRLTSESLSLGIFERVLMVIIALPFIFFFFGLAAFHIAYNSGFTTFLAAFVLISGVAFVLISGVVFYLIKWIYVTKIKNYPEIIITITKENLHLFLVKRNKNHHCFLTRHYSLGIPFSELSQMFYGEIDKRTKKLGKSFLIKKNNEVLLRGKLKIKDNRFVNHRIHEDYLLPIDELRRIYIGKTSS